MGRYLSGDFNVSGAPGLNKGAAPHPDFPVTGIFGQGLIRFFTESGTFTVPDGCTKVRVRVWGGGSRGGGNVAPFNGGGGGGFSMKVCTVTPGDNITVTVAAASTTSPGQTSSFGAFCSATGGSTASGAVAGSGGTGVGGDYNSTGGSVPIGNNGGGGAASAVGDGGDSGRSGASGGGGIGVNSGGSGFTGQGGANLMPGLPGNPNFSIDFIGTGGGGGAKASGANGGGGGEGAAANPLSGNGGYPGGGAGGNTTPGSQYLVPGAPGLVIVEW